jgi:uncharacterized protein DUF6114
MPRGSAFWRWRHARPFWGGLFVLLGGAEMLVVGKAPLPVVVHVGPTGLAGFLVPILLVLCGALLLVSPQQRLFYSLVAAILALGSWITSNLGGFLIGLLLALVGAALAFAWSPTKKIIQTGNGAPGVQPETSHNLPRHNRVSPGSLSGE